MLFTVDHSRRVAVMAKNQGAESVTISSKIEEDISNLYLGSDVFKRSTTFSLGIPEEGEAHLDSSTASQVTTLHIHTTDSITGNRFTTLSEFQQYDHIII